MYTLCLKKNFIARHFLIGGDWGDENNPHAHHYVLELRLSAMDLDRHEYLVDLVEVEGYLDRIISGYRDSMLNKHDSFGDRNPSLELFARIIWEEFSRLLKDRNIHELSVRLWENESAWAQWRGRPE